jgi:hypothetical protein
MIAIDNMTEEEFKRHAFALLRREFGLDGLARFLRLNRAGTGDHTRDRHHWLEGSTIQGIIPEVKSRRNPAM